MPYLLRYTFAAKTLPQLRGRFCVYKHGRHPEEQGLSSFCWYMAADGSLVIYYPEAVLASYAAGAFTLTIPREDAPHLFTAAYPMD